MKTNKIIEIAYGIGVQRAAGDRWPDVGTREDKARALHATAQLKELHAKARRDAMFFWAFAIGAGILFISVFAVILVGTVKEKPTSAERERQEQTLEVRK